MNIVGIGGGPADLYFAISVKLRSPSHIIFILKRNWAADTFGWGDVLSEETLANLAANDATCADAIRTHLNDIAVVREGVPSVSSGHGFCGIGRRQLLLLSQQRTCELGVDLRFVTEVEDIAALMRDYDSSRRSSIAASRSSPQLRAMRWAGAANSR